MPPINGAEVLLLANTGTDAVPVWTVVGSQRDASLTENVAEVDTSSKDSPRQTVIGGRYSASISLDALYVPGDVAYGKLRDALRARTLIKVRVREAAADVQEATALVTSLDRSFPDQGESTVSISLTVSGSWTTLP